MQNNNILIITSSGGNGHIQTANAIAANIIESKSDANVIFKDLVFDWIGKMIGSVILTRFWNGAQRNGRPLFRKIFASLRPVADIFCFLPVFFHAYFTLKKNNIERVIDCQPTCTLAIIKAIKVYNKVHCKHLILEKMAMELPTLSTRYFFSSIKQLSKSDLKVFKLYSTKPLLEIDDTEDAFWKRLTNLRRRDIIYSALPIRKAFSSLIGVCPEGEIPVYLKTSSLAEKNYLEDLLSLQNIPFVNELKQIELELPSRAQIITIVLSSEPCERAGLEYLKQIISMQKGHENTYIFVYCGDFVKSKSFFVNVANLCKSCMNQRIKIVPMSFQEDLVIATLYHRSDQTITCSGGATSMELVSMSNGQIFIHSNCRKNTTVIEKLFQGMPSWEAGNAKYLMQKKGAIVTTPFSYPIFSKQIRESNEQQVRPNPSLEYND